MLSIIANNFLLGIFVRIDIQNQKEDIALKCYIENVSQSMRKIRNPFHLIVCLSSHE